MGSYPHGVPLPLWFSGVQLCELYLQCQKWLRQVRGIMDADGSLLSFELHRYQADCSKRASYHPTSVFKILSVLLWLEMLLSMGLKWQERVPLEETGSDAASVLDPTLLSQMKSDQYFGSFCYLGEKKRKFYHWIFRYSIINLPYKVLILFLSPHPCVIIQF